MIEEIEVSRMFAQELYSLYLNKTLELYLNIMENVVFEFTILYIIYYEMYAICYI